MNIKKKSLCGRHGFTMMELLIVVAIIGILAAISMPNIVSMKKQLEMAKLDEYAKQIYLAAQNEAVKLKASGELENFYKEVEAQHRSDWNLEHIGDGAKPQDYPDNPETAGVSPWKLLYYIPSDDTLTLKYFKQTNVVLTEATERGGSFIMELNPLTGDVYSAFYSENPLSYGTVTSLSTRNRADRQPLAIGYYCGSSGNSATALPSSFEPRISFRNEEELWLDITCPGMLRANGTQRKLKINITFTDEHDKEFQKELKGGSDFTVSGDQLEVHCLLDSMDNRNAFSSINGFTEGTLTPGDNITVTAQIAYNNGGINIEGSDTGSVNSLFESRETTDEGTSSQITIKVNCLRHLNNLRRSKYTHPENSPKTTVLQTGSIDFAERKREDATDFKAITNSSLFNLETTVFNGNNNILSTFNFSPDSAVNTNTYTGLFGELKNCTLENIQLVDCKTTGTDYTGTLVGYTDSVVLHNCRVYLQNTKNGVFQDMETIVKDRMVTGGMYVGGLVGRCQNSSVDNCFAAIYVSGKSYVGGLIGIVENTLQNHYIQGCYSSGDVTADTSTAGGLIGQVSNVSNLSDCYSTSDVFCNDQSGGFVGSSSGSIYANNISYGQVLNKAGDNIGTNSGGFIAGNSTGSGNLFTNCIYLLQPGYNSAFSSSTTNGITQEFYTSLESTNLYTGYPYKKKLMGTNFPFSPISYTDDGTDTTLPHYGDWPSEIRLQTSLVYYERYQKGETDENGNVKEEYGYYAETSLLSDEDAANEVDIWTIDTLQDRVCLEDGYAIVSPYALKLYDYVLNEDAPKMHQSKGTYTLTESDAISSDATFLFKNTDKDGKESTYKISNCKVFRLPFELQMTQRESATRFYDQLKITGYLAQGATPVFENYTFYYCPDFAKNAINPALAATYAKCPPDPGSKVNGEIIDPSVYIRSARQLNALGRNSYYWNETYNGTDNDESHGRKFYFKQETDIDFGIYGKDELSSTKDKTYCGKAFNLMDVNLTVEGVSYKNRPIGRAGWNPVAEKRKSRNFQYTYDGLGNKIIDYCLTTNGTTNQFAGLFGEIRYATIKNVIMTASDPDSGSAYIISQFYDPVYQGSTTGTGIGVLVGLAWANDSDTLDQRAVIENCAISGYKVSYESNTVTNNVAVGGLIGFNFGVVRNCSAVNKETAIIISDTGNSYNFSLGGLAGSNTGNGEITGSYTGGSLKTQIPKGIGSLYCSGITNSFYIKGATENAKKAMQVTGCYSYCTWKKENFPASANNSHLYPVAPPKSKQNNKLVTVKNCYYFKDTTEDNFPFESGSTNSNSTNYQVSSVSLDTYNDLFDILKPYGFGSADQEHSHPWKEQDSTLLTGEYPFPATVKTVEDTEATNNTYVHYGRWPDVPKAPSTVYPCYYEKYTNPDTSETSYGFYYWDSDGSLVRTLDDKNKLDIVKTGYGILTSDYKDFIFLYGKNYGNNLTEQTTGADILSEKAETTFNELSLYPFDPYSSPEKIDVSEDTAQVARAFGISYKRDGSDAKTFYVNTKFAANIFIQNPTEINETENHYAEIRTLNQLRNLDNMYNFKWYFNQTHNISAYLDDITEDFRYGLIDNNSSDSNGGYTYDGRTDDSIDPDPDKKNNEIYDLTYPLFDTNNGAIRNVILNNPRIDNDSKDAAPLALTNAGHIDSCLVTGSGAVTGTAFVSGMVCKNTGFITNSSVENCTIQALENGSSAGFVFEQADSGSITGCAVRNCNINSNRETGVASGFINTIGSSNYNQSSIIENCQVTETSVYASGDASGFINRALSSASIRNCSINNTNHTVSSTSQRASGFAISNGGTIDSCQVASSVSSQKECAGFTIEHSGSIINCSVTLPGNIRNTDNGPYIWSTQSDAAGFALIASGSIDSCYVYSSIDSSRNSAGFAMTNSASINKCYVSAKIRGGNSAGFVYTPGGSIKNCYTAGSVYAAGGSSGFYLTQPAGWVDNCYSIASVEGQTLYSCYGFGPSSSNIRNCYWVSTTDYNTVIKNNSSSGTMLSTFLELTKLANKLNDGKNFWEMKTVEQTHPATETMNGSAYPYPGLQNLDHYGDWPVGKYEVAFVNEFIGAYRPEYIYDRNFQRQYMIGAGLNKNDFQSAASYRSDLNLTWKPKVYCVFFKTINTQELRSWDVEYDYYPGSSDKLKTDTLGLVSQNYDQTSYMNINNRLYTKFKITPSNGTYKMSEIRILAPRTGPKDKRQVYHFLIDEVGIPYFKGWTWEP